MGEGWGVVCTAWCVPVYWLGPNLAGVRVMAAPHSCSSHRVGVAILSMTAGAGAGTRAGAGAGPEPELEPELGPGL